LSYDWRQFGAFISGSQLFENRIKNLHDSKFASGSGVNAVDKAMDEIAWAWNNAPDEGKFNRSSVPRYNVSIGGYYDITENYSISGIWKHHGKIAVRSEEFWADYYHPSVFTGGSTVDLTATAKNVGLKNLNLSIIGKNVTNKLYLNGNAMDPGHYYEIEPVSYEVKVNYLW
jgi:outer membrane receptor protein involved in Fe transport